VSNADAYSRMLDAFAEAIEEGRGFLAPGRDGLLNQRVLDAAFASWRSGKREAVRG
jgi:predicted dehydrogenase